MADLIATPLRVSLEREEAVDFTTRFYEDDYSIFIKPKTLPHYYFVYPLSTISWIAFFVAMVGIWIVLVLFATVSSYSFENPAGRGHSVFSRSASLAMVVLRITLSQSKYSMTNMWVLCNNNEPLFCCINRFCCCIAANCRKKHPVGDLCWFCKFIVNISWLFTINLKLSLSGLCTSAPSTSVKLVTHATWLMMTILVATYVGNLVAAMATEKLILPFETLAEFAEQNEYIPGYARGGLAELLLKVCF